MLLEELLPHGCAGKLYNAGNGVTLLMVASGPSAYANEQTLAHIMQLATAGAIAENLARGTRPHHNSF